MRTRQITRLVVAGSVVAGLVAFVLACQRKPAETGAPSPSPAFATDTSLVEGERAYLANCAMCHGEWGDGNGPLAAELRKQGAPSPANLASRERLQQIGRAEVVRVIQRGGAHTGRSNLMPPWGERLPAATIERIADFVMALPELSLGTPPATLARYLEAPPGAPDAGRKLFVFYCTPCHGPFGKGDGAHADTILARIHIRPRDLTDSTYMARITDRDLFATVSLGGGHFRKSTYMPAWNVTLTPDQIKDLVSYVRVISRTTPQP